MDFYEREIVRLKLEMDSVMEIREALPNKCWNKIRLEP